MKLSKKIALLATALLSLALISCKTDTSETDTSETGSSNPNPTLPGTKDGKDNEKDIFAGKIFYDSSEKDKSESYTKYAFSTEGTVEISNKDSSDEKVTPIAVINYSFSEDYNIVYMTYNKIRIPSNIPISNNDKLYTYTEFEQYFYNDCAKEMLDYLNNSSYSEKQKKVMKDDIAKTCGLASYTTDEELLAAMQEYSKEHAKEILTPIYKTFDTVFQYDLSKDEVDIPPHPILTEKNTWGKDLSKFISLQDHTYYHYYQYYSPDDPLGEYFYFNYSYGDFDASYHDVKTNSSYYLEKVDSSKIYFESSDEEGNTIKLEASYTISDDGNTLTLTIGEKTIEAKLHLDQIYLYQ